MVFLVRQNNILRVIVGTTRPKHETIHTHAYVVAFGFDALPHEHAGSFDPIHPAWLRAYLIGRNWRERLAFKIDWCVCVEGTHPVYVVWSVGILWGWRTTEVWLQAPPSRAYLDLEKGCQKHFNLKSVLNLLLSFIIINPLISALWLPLHRTKSNQNSTPTAIITHKER